MPLPRLMTEVTSGDRAALQEQVEGEKESVQNENLRRTQLLDSVQCGIVAGNFQQVLSLIDQEDADLVGTSDDRFEFFSDLMFFKIVSLTERLSLILL